MEIQAKFFPVGHGLTYAFKIDKFHILFDINRSCNFNDLEAFFGDKSIDVMIISHFHADHMNGIIKLHKHGFTIKKIYIPYADDDITLFYELYFHFGRIDNDFNDLRDYLDQISEVIAIEDTIFFSYPPVKNMWIFNIYQHRGNEDTVILNIKNGLRKLGLFTNADIRNNLVKLKNDIKKVYKASIRNLNKTSIFLVHGPEENIVFSSEFTGLEYISRKLKRDKQPNFYTLITGDCSLADNKSVINNYASNLGYVLVPHHSGTEEWASYLCEHKDNRDISWIVTISEVKSRPYGLVVSDIYHNHQKLYICDKKTGFIYSFLT